MRSPARRALPIVLAASLVASFAGPPASAVPAPAFAAACAGPTPDAGAAFVSGPGGDFNGDGVNDTVAGDPFAAAGGQAGAGAVHVLFGRGEGGVILRAPRPEAGAAFGWSVRLAYIDGDRCADLLIGAPYEEVDGVRDAGAAYILYGGPQPRTVRLTSPTPETESHFGWSVASAGGLMAVGAPYEDADGVRDAGAVHLFESGAPGPGRRISQGDEGITGNSETGDMFGWSVVFGRLGGARDRPDLVVGAPYENDDGAGQQSGGGTLDSGAITVLFDVRDSPEKYVNKKWDLKDVMAANTGDRFGYAMAYAEEGETGYLAVSAPLGDGGQVKDSGVVRLFRASGAEDLAPWSTVDQGPGGAEGGGYGFSLAMTGEGGARLAVGAPFGKAGQGGVWLVPLADPGQARLIEQGEGGDHFGWSVAFSGNRLVVGVPDRGVSGAVALLGRNDGTGTLLAPGSGGLPAVEGGGSADFGAAVG